jgi:hypothetical protein
MIVGRPEPQTKQLCGRVIGGEGGIRTPDTVARMPHFECGAFNRSATSPNHYKTEETGVDAG